MVDSFIFFSIIHLLKLVSSRKNLPNDNKTGVTYLISLISIFISCAKGIDISWGPRTLTVPFVKASPCQDKSVIHKAILQELAS